MLIIDDLLYRREDFQLSIDHLQINKGITMIVGSNGAGKSTLLQLIATALQPDGGFIEYGGMTVQEHLPYVRSDIGFLPTGLEIYDEMTVSKFLTYMSQLKGEVNKAEINELLLNFSLDEIKHKKVKKLSQGMIQRLAIAQAFINKPDFVLLDEPLIALDSRERRHLISYCNQYSFNRTIIVATHELNEWGTQADFILWMDEGTLRFHGTPSEWLSDLPLTVWTGVISREQLPSFQNENVISCKLNKHHAELKLIGEVAPHPTFRTVPPTIEDAYFIRKKQRLL